MTLSGHFTLRNIGIAATLLVMAAAARAEVYVEFPLLPIESFVVGLSGSQAGEPNLITMQGQDYVVSRWTLAQDVGFVAAAVEARMDELLFGGDQGEDAVQYVEDELAVFAALSRGDGAADDPAFPSYARTILLRPLETRTEMIVTDRIGAAPEEARLAELAQAMRWSIEGEWPEWQSSESLVSTWRQTAMFVTDMSENDRISARRQQLENSGFNILDITTSQNGIMISAANNRELVSAFSYVDEYGANVEIVVHEIHNGEDG